MSKNKIIMSAIGGVAVVIALVLGYLTYAAWEEKEEGVDTLDSMKARVKKLSNETIAPSMASVEAINENTKSLAMWFGRAFEVASRGDRIYPTLTVAEFCNQLRDEVAEARNLPGSKGGKIVAEDFSFGFGDILDSGKLPKSDELPVLQRQWGDIKLFTETLSAAGAVQLTKIEKEAPKPAVAEPEPAPVAQRGRKPAQPQKVETKPLADSQTYTIEFLARPLALVSAINEFGRNERFIVIDTMNFFRTPDALGDVLGGKDKEEGKPSRRGKNRRSRSVQEEQPTEGGEEEIRRKGLVIDPVTDTPFTVKMKITTYDFGTKTSEEEPAEATEGEEEAK